MFAEEYFAAYPDAGFFAAPGLPEKRTDLPFGGVLGDEPEPGWAKDIQRSAWKTPLVAAFTPTYAGFVTRSVKGARTRP